MYKDHPDVYRFFITKVICDWIYENRSYRPRQEVFDFFTQTQSLMNALSSFTATVDQSKVVCFCWLLF